MSSDAQTCRTRSSTCCEAQTKHLLQLMSSDTQACQTRSLFSVALLKPACSSLCLRLVKRNLQSAVRLRPCICSSSCHATHRLVRGALCFPLRGSDQLAPAHALGLSCAIFDLLWSSNHAFTSAHVIGLSDTIFNLLQGSNQVLAPALGLRVHVPNQLAPAHALGLSLSIRCEAQTRHLLQLMSSHAQACQTRSQICCEAQTKHLLQLMSPDAQDFLMRSLFSVAWLEPACSSLCIRLVERDLRFVVRLKPRMCLAHVIFLQLCVMLRPYLCSSSCPTHRLVERDL